MTAPTPLLAHKDALVRALTTGDHVNGRPLVLSTPERIADALLASGILQTPAEFATTLADDEALRVVADALRSFIPDANWSIYATSGVAARVALRALAKALSEREAQR